MAVPLSACSTEPTENPFQSPLPWHVSSASYEKLDYSVAIYDTTAGTSEKSRTKIADGTMSFVLDETYGGGFTSLDMNFSVTYNDSAAAGGDKGLTDTITSTVRFDPNGLNTAYMKKTVNLADRANVVNPSYEIEADYFDSHVASYLRIKQDGATPAKLSLPKDPCHDNETMFFLARAQGINGGSSTFFNMVNIFDSFINGSLTSYKIMVSGGGNTTLDIGDFVKDFGVEKVTDEKTQAESYPVKCFSVALGISGERSGPPHVVTYSAAPFKYNNEEHAKIPVRMEYAQYNGAKPYRQTVYTLNGCSFAKQA